MEIIYDNYKRGSTIKIITHFRLEIIYVWMINNIQRKRKPTNNKNIHRWFWFFVCLVL